MADVFEKTKKFASDSAYCNFVNFFFFLSMTT